MTANLTNLLRCSGLLNFTRNRHLCLFRDERKIHLEIINRACFRKKCINTKTADSRMRLANYCAIITETTVIHIDFISIKHSILDQNNSAVKKLITRLNLASGPTTGFHRRPKLGTWRSKNASISYHEACVDKHQETQPTHKVNIVR
jgi:hypothetical protein